MERQMVSNAFDQYFPWFAKPCPLSRVGDNWLCQGKNFFIRSTSTWIVESDYGSMLLGHAGIAAGFGKHR